MPGIMPQVGGGGEGRSVWCRNCCGGATAFSRPRGAVLQSADVTKGRTFWRLLALLLGPVVTMALVSLALYQVSVWNLRTSLVDELHGSLVRVAERHQASIREILALSQTISRDPRVVGFYEDAYESDSELDVPKPLTDLLLMYRAWRSDLDSIVLLGSRQDPVLASDDTYSRATLRNIFAEPATGPAAESDEERREVVSVRLHSGMQLGTGPSREVLFLVRPTIIAGRPARLAFLMREEYPEEALYDILGDRPARVDITARGVLDDDLVVYRDPEAPREDPVSEQRGGVRVTLDAARADFRYSVWIPPSAVRADIMPAQAMLILPLTAGLAIAALLTLLVSNRIYRPVRQLVQTFRTNETPPSPGRDEIQYVLQTSDELVARVARMRSSLQRIAPFAAEDILSRALIGGERDAVLSLADVPGWAEGDARDVRFVVALISLNARGTGHPVSTATEELRRILSALVTDHRVFFVHVHPGVFVALFIDRQSADAVVDEDLLRESVRLIKDRHEGMTVVAGCSGPHGDLMELQQGFVRARVSHAAAFAQGREVASNAAFPYPVSRVSRDDEARFVNLVRAGRADEAIPLVAGLLVGRSSRASPAMVVQAASLTASAAAAAGSAEDRADALLLRAMSDSIREADRAVIQAEVLNLVEELCGSAQPPVRAVDWPTLREYLETHFADDLHLAGIAETFGVSERTLSSLISENSLQSFPGLLNSIRCGAAKRLIAENPGTSLRSIAAQVGYRSERTFFRQFKLVTGLRPAEFKRQVTPRGNRH